MTSKKRTISRLVTSLALFFIDAPFNQLNPFALGKIGERHVIGEVWRDAQEEVLVHEVCEVNQLVGSSLPIIP